MLRGWVRGWALWGFALCVAGVLYGVFRPEPPQELFAHSDKWGHVVAFGALALFARLAFPRVSALGVWLPLLALAPLLEVLQGALRPGRVFSLEDALANVIGVVLALACHWLWCRCLSGWQWRQAEDVPPG